MPPNNTSMTKFPNNEKAIVINNVSRYLENMTLYDSFKILDNYESNNGESLGKVYETKIFDLLKSILNENGYEIIMNVEFMFSNEISGSKLEYDYMIGKIVEDTFVIYGTFDAKISKALVNKRDIEKFTQNINNLKQKKLQLRYIRGKDYLSMFSKVTPHPDTEIIVGYFCKPYVNYDKEVSKVISSYLINHSKTSFELINDCHITFSDSMFLEIDKIIRSDQTELIQLLESNNIRIYDQKLV